MGEGVLPVLGVLRVLTKGERLGYKGRVSAEGFSRSFVDERPECAKEYAKRRRESSGRAVEVMGCG